MHKIINYIPITIRGFAFGLLAILALKFRALPEFDLILQALGYSCLVAIFVAFIGTLLGYFLLHNNLKNLNLVFFNEANPQELNSDSEISIVITNNYLYVPPFLRVILTPIFDRPEISTSSIIITGRHRPLSLKISFKAPHRGIWCLKDFEISIQDCFGFTKLNSTSHFNQEFEVYPRELIIADLPFVSESSVSGEESRHAKEPIGDMFDLKPYDPSDGVKRILWKIYSRSGELVSRKPELAAVPDGEIAIFLIAAKTDDKLCGYFRNYLRQTREKGLQVIFGTDGINFDDTCVTDDETILNNINRYVFDKTAGTGAGVQQFTNYLSVKHPNINCILIFANDYPTFSQTLNIRYEIASPKIYDSTLKIEELR